MIETPIRTTDDARKFLQFLVDTDRFFHLDDDPADIINYDTHKPVFTKKEATQVSKRMAEMFAVCNPWELVEFVPEKDKVIIK